MSRPLLLIVTGPPGAGKTTLARKIAREFRLPLIAKDDIKETLFDTLGWKDREWSKQLGGATYELIYYFVETLLSAGQSLIVESNFSEGATPRFRAWQTKYDLAILRILLQCDRAILLERFKSRWSSGERHPGHVDHESSDAEIAAILERNERALDLDSMLIEIDTTNFEAIDYAGLFDAVRRAMLS
ncbi:MAG: ATP-binding protein [Chloroflexi bacterium]|nr:ATP-binding protein [Chloroflexota bacterium]